MSSEYDRPGRDDGADACRYTSYDTTADEAVQESAGDDGESAGDGSASDGSAGEGYAETETVDGEVPATGAGATGLDRRVWQALYDVEDPEMPVSVVDLGLVYGVDVDEVAGEARVDMTLTYTGCPAREMLLGDVERSVAGVDGIEDVEVRLVWSPGWTVDLVTPEGRKALEEFGLSVPSP